MERPHLLIIGLGGSGIAVLNALPRIGRRGIKMVAADADPVALKSARVRTRIDLGRGKASKALATAFANADRLLLVAGLGGATATAATLSLISQALRAEKRIALVALTPFPFEDAACHERALQALEALRDAPIMKMYYHGTELLPFVHPSQSADEAWREIDLLLSDSVAALAYSLQELGHNHSDMEHEPEQERRPWETNE